MDKSGGHAQHVDHSGHEDMFRKRFWISLLLSIPVLLYTPMLQMWFGFMMPDFAGSKWVMPLFAIIVFVYGGVPFIQMAIPEIRNRQPGMMTLISLAISVSFIYSLATTFVNLGEGFFWELVTLIDIMLLGHWIEMRSVRQASGALNALAKLMPDNAEHVMPDGTTHTMPVSSLKTGDLVTLERVVTVLVIACPHALGLAVPLVVAISTTSAAQNGILVRDRLALEAAREINVVIFDKTGTLTKGEQGVVSIKSNGVDENHALALTAAVEADSEH